MEISTTFLYRLNLRHFFPLHLGIEVVLFTLFQVIFLKVNIFRIHVLVYISKPISGVFKVPEKIQSFP